MCRNRGTSERDSSKQYTLENPKWLWGKKNDSSIEEAREYAWNAKEKELKGKMDKKMIMGTPSKVKHQLLELQEKYQADEIMLITITHKLEDRLKSYRLIAKELLLN